MRELESERGGGVADEQGVGAHDGRRDRRDVVRVEGLGGGAPGAVDRRVVPLWCAHRFRLISARSESGSRGSADGVGSAGRADDETGADDEELGKSALGSSSVAESAAPLRRSATNRARQ